MREAQLTTNLGPMAPAAERRRPFYRDSLAARLMLVMGGLVVGTALVFSALAVSLLSSELEAVSQAKLNRAKQLADDDIRQTVEDVSLLARLLQSDPSLNATAP